MPVAHPYTPCFRFWSANGLIVFQMYSPPSLSFSLSFSLSSHSLILGCWDSVWSCDELERRQSWSVTEDRMPISLRKRLHCAWETGGTDVSSAAHHTHARTHALTHTQTRHRKLCGARGKGAFSTPQEEVKDKSLAKTHLERSAGHAGVAFWLRETCGIYREIFLFSWKRPGFPFHPFAFNFCSFNFISSASLKQLSSPESQYCSSVRCVTKTGDASLSAHERYKHLPLSVALLYPIYYLYLSLFIWDFIVCFGASVVILVEYGGGNGNEREAEADPRLSDAADER